MNKLEILASDYGFDSVDDMLQEACFDAVVPGICLRDDCDYSTEVEPDQNEGWCEECEEGTVASCLILAGII